MRAVLQALAALKLPPATERLLSMKNRNIRIAAHLFSTSLRFGWTPPIGGSDGREDLSADRAKT